MRDRDNSRRTATERARRAVRAATVVCKLEGCDKHVDGGRLVCPMHHQRMKHFGSYDKPMRVYPPKKVKAPKQPEARECQVCRVAFYGRRRVCSAECAAIRTHESNVYWGRERNARHVAVESVPFTCRNCGTEFLGYAKQRRAYCGGRCRKRADKDRRTMLKRGAFIEDVWRTKVYARDGYVCQLCRKRVLMDKAVPHPKAPTLDHVIPLARGGTHEYANVQLAHFLCNSIKSAGDAQLNLALVGVA